MADGPPHVTFEHHRGSYPRNGRRRRYYPAFDDSNSSSSSDSDSSSCDGDYPAIYLPHEGHRRRREHRRHHYVPVVAAATNRLLTTTTTNARPVVPYQPRNYGYRRLHVQGGQERGRRRTRSSNTHAHGHGRCHTQRGRCGGRSPRRCILTRIGRAIVGDPIDRCRCGRSCGGCNGSRSRSRSRSPMRHREEEYWGQGTHNWAYGPPGLNGNSSNGGWRDTPWSRPNNNSNDPSNPYNLGPGGMVEEIEEGGTLPANLNTSSPAIAAVATNEPAPHNHYHIGSSKRQRSRRRGGGRDFMRQYAEYARARDRDEGVLGLVDRERDRELDRNMVDRETANRRDLRMLTLLDRERERDRAGIDVMSLLDRELERRRGSRPEVRAGKPSIGEESDTGVESGLRAEIEALRRDLKKMAMSPLVVRGGSGDKSGRGHRSGSTAIVAPSPAQRSPAAPEIQFSHGESKPRDRGRARRVRDHDDGHEFPLPGSSTDRSARRTLSEDDAYSASGSQQS